MSQPLSKTEQDAVFQVASEMGKKLAASFSGLLAIDHPESTVALWSKRFRENFERVARMTPEEHAVYERENKEIEKLYQIRQDLIDAEEEYSSAVWKVKRARKAARKDKVTVNDTFEMLQVRGRKNAHKS